MTAESIEQQLDSSTRIVCPPWCERSQKEHLAVIEEENGSEGTCLHRREETGDGWYVILGVTSTLAGGPVGPVGVMAGAECLESLRNARAFAQALLDAADSMEA